MARRVLVTRPEPGCSATAARLAAAGFEPIASPLTRIVPIPWELPSGTFDAAMATSANALRMAGRNLAARYRDLPLFAVGAATAEAARDAGFHEVVTGPGNAEDLAASIAAQFPRGTRLLYLTGRVRLSSAESLLASAGPLVIPVETYDTVRTGLGPADLAACLGRRPVDAALVYSRLAAEALSEAAGDPGVTAFFETTVVLCLSQRTAGGLSAFLRARARVATEPREETLLSMI